MTSPGAMGDGEAPASRAARLRRRATADPGDVSVPALLALLEGDEPVAREDALHALWTVAAERPGDCALAVPVLRRLLEDDTVAFDARVLETLAALASADPADVAPHAAAVGGHLGSSDAAASRAAARCVASLAGHDPADVLELVPELASMVRDDAEGRQYAVEALSHAARSDPKVVRRAAPALQDAAVDGTATADERLAATAALGRLAEAYPDTPLPVVDDLADLVDADHDRLRNNAIGVLGAVAAHHPDHVAPHVPALAAALDADDWSARAHVTAALARVAETHPEAVEPHVDALIDWLDDERERVRDNACRALCHLDASAARDALESVAEGDESATVRASAYRALHRLDR